MIVYHRASNQELSAILSEGLKVAKRGDLGSNPAIAAADKFLDAHCPKPLLDKNISRQHNAYAYLPAGDDCVIDIKDGSIVPLSLFIQEQEQSVLALDIDPTRCFVSDLDAYDHLKLTLEHQGASASTIALAERYWQSLRNLVEYQDQSIKRPELMITYDISPEHIEHVSPET